MAVKGKQPQVKWKRNGVAIRVKLKGFKHVGMENAPYGYVFLMGRKELPFMPLGLDADNILLGEAVVRLANQPSMADEPDFHLGIIAKLQTEYAGFSLEQRLRTFCRPDVLMAMWNQSKNCVNKSELSTFKLDMDRLKSNHVSISADVRQLQSDVRNLQAFQTSATQRMNNLETFQANATQRMDNLEATKVSTSDFDTKVLAVMSSPAGQKLIRQNNVAKAVQVMQSADSGSEDCLNLLFFHAECTAMNEALRAARSPAEWEAPLLWYVGKMDRNVFTALKAPKYTKTVYRGMNLQNLTEEERNYWLNMDVGHFISDKAYLCTSKSMDVARGFAFGRRDPVNSRPYLFTITTHTSGRSIEKHVSQYFRWEKEVLFPRETVFRVTKRDMEYLDHITEAHGKINRLCHLIEVEEIRR